jgi:hypothetical protein
VQVLERTKGGDAPGGGILEVALPLFGSQTSWAQVCALCLLFVGEVVQMRMARMLWGCLFGMFALPRLSGSSWGHIVNAPCYSCPASTVPLRLVLRGGKGRDGLASTEVQGEEGSRERGKVPLQSCRGLVGGALCDCRVNPWANDSFATKCV